MTWYDRWNPDYGPEPARATAQPFIGRDGELRQVDDLLREAGGGGGPQLLHWSGTAGLGKSFLLRQIRSCAASAGVLYAYVDSRDAAGHAESFAALLLSQLPPAPGELLPNPWNITKDYTALCLERLHACAASSAVLLAIDTYEAMGEVDGWMREVFVPQLPPQVLLVTAGRRPLPGPWKLLRGGLKRIVESELRGYDPEEVRFYCEAWGIREEETVWRLLALTHGHPDTLAYAVSSGQEGEAAAAGESLLWQEELRRNRLAGWLRELPEGDGELRELLEAAAHLPEFDLEALAWLEGGIVGAGVYSRLLDLSFVEEAEGGWTLHPVLRELLLSESQRKPPAAYADRERPFRPAQPSRGSTLL